MPPVTELGGAVFLQEAAEEDEMFLLVGEEAGAEVLGNDPGDTLRRTVPRKWTYGYSADDGYRVAQYCSVRFNAQADRLGWCYAAIVPRWPFGIESWIHVTG